MPRNIEPVSIESSAGRLFGVYHPAEGGDRVVVICPPFAEEKKTSYRILYEQAEDLAASGVPVLRFDYFGTGDSDGAFDECSAAGWIEDIVAASGFASERAEAEHVCLLGLRLGGTLAAACRCDRLVLWQPLMDPRGYLKASVKRQAMRQKLIGGNGETAGEIDGYPITEKLAASIEALTAGIAHGDCLLMQISYSDRILPEYAPLRDRQGIELRAVTMEPIWNRLGRIDAGELIRATTAWITRPL